MAYTGPHDQSGSASPSTAGWSWGAGVAVGLGIGVALGVALDNLAVGIALGVAFFPVFAMVRGSTTSEDEVPSDGESLPGGDT
ncbi:hypothetical protein APR04_000671 [Promicromonospora umidemergens]|uniref:Glycine zipper-like domain-containing protein n=1 Tax=Promicromonospora umidemergens TaxID=629679 RepID=A0ABP8XE67_9MICO|nr:hypothetical protein [Promicromonospora umidemergens]MCP2281782.1 hypothetical protein [Promicromonospora umidemergens]